MDFVRSKESTTGLKLVSQSEAGEYSKLAQQIVIMITIRFLLSEKQTYRESGNLKRKLEQV